MCFICVASAGLRWVGFAKILEYKVIGLPEPIHSEERLFKSSAYEWISLIARRCDATEDNDALEFVNVMLLNITNVERF